MRSGRRWILGAFAAALLGAAPAVADELEPVTPGQPAGEAAQSAGGTPSRNAAVQAAALALRRDPLYVARAGIDPKVALGAEDQRTVRAQLAGLGQPVFVAVLPDVGEPAAVLDAVARATGRDGSYLVVTGRTLRAQSNTLPPGSIAEITRDAFDARHEQGLAAVLRQSFDALRATVRGGVIATTTPEDDEGGVPAVVIVFASIGAGITALFALIMFLIRRQMRRMASAATGPAFWSSGAFRDLAARRGGGNSSGATTADGPWTSATSAFGDSSPSSPSDSGSSGSSDSGGSFDSGSSSDSGGTF